MPGRLFGPSVGKTQSRAAPYITVRGESRAEHPNAPRLRRTRRGAWQATPPSPAPGPAATRANVGSGTASHADAIPARGGSAWGGDGGGQDSGWRGLRAFRFGAPGRLFCLGLQAPSSSAFPPVNCSQRWTMTSQ